MKDVKSMKEVAVWLSLDDLQVLHGR